LFDIIGRDIEGTYFLDLFAGTGAVGIEALSRGAKKAIFIDKFSKCIEIIEENLEKTKNSQNAEVCKSDFLLGLRLLSKREYLLDYIFIDPPYNQRLAEVSLIEISKLSILKKSSLVIVEHYKKEKIEDSIGYLKLFKQKVYGEHLLSFYKYEET